MNTLERAAVALLPLALLLSAADASRVIAQPAAPAAPAANTIVEVGYGQANLTANFPTWRNAYARVTYANGGGSAATYQIEAVHRRAFGEAASHLGLAVTRDLSRDWYASVNAGASAGDFLFPRVNAGAGMYLLARLLTVVHWISGRS